MSNLKFTEAHEWIRIEGEGNVTIGISNFAQEQLGDVVYVDLPDVGTEVLTGDDLAVVESVKTAGEIKAPIGGNVIEVNERLADEPEIVNTDPMGDGWFIRMKVEDQGELESYMNEADYNEFISSM